jgi:polyhydroxybutyrate depolymerase
VRRVLAVVLAISVLGCMGGARRGGNATGDVTGAARAVELTVRSGGDDRTAWVHFPQGATGDVPVVVMLHGGGREGPDRGRAMLHVWESHFDEPIVFAFPNAEFREETAWNGPDAPDPQRDLRFLRDLLDEIDRRADIDRKRLYLAGFSAGAAFTWYAQCVDPGPWRGFAMTGFSYPDRLADLCDRGEKRPVIYVHGTEDARIPFERNEYSRGGAPASFEWLRRSRRCGGPASEPIRTGTRGVTLKGQAFDCPAGAIETWRAEGQGHCVGTRDGDCGGYEWSDLVLDFWKRNAGF